MRRIHEKLDGIFPGGKQKAKKEGEGSGNPRPAKKTKTTKGKGKARVGDDENNEMDHAGLTAPGEKRKRANAITVGTG